MLHPFLMGFLDGIPDGDGIRVQSRITLSA
jgi:hypothetical protein